MLDTNSKCVKITTYKQLDNHQPLSTATVPNNVNNEET